MSGVTGALRYKPAGKGRLRADDVKEIETINLN